MTHGPSKLRANTYASASGFRREFKKSKNVEITKADIIGTEEESKHWHLLNNSCCSGSNLTKGVNMSHNIVTPLFLLLSRDLKLDRTEMLVHLLINQVDCI
jgi:hypothetical protein